MVKKNGLYLAETKIFDNFYKFLTPWGAKFDRIFLKIQSGVLPIPMNVYVRFEIDWLKNMDLIARKPIRTDRRTDRRTDGRTDGQTDRQTVRVMTIPYGPMGAEGKNCPIKMFH